MIILHLDINKVFCNISGVLRRTEGPNNYYDLPMTEKQCRGVYPVENFQITSMCR